MWKSNLLVSNFHTHPPGIRNHRFTKLNKRTSNENHQREPFQKSSNYIYIYTYIYIWPYIYILSPPKQNNCKALYFDNKTFPLLIKIPSTTKPPIFSNKIPGLKTPPHLSGDMRRCDAQGVHVTSRLNHTQPLRRIVTQVERVARWKDWRIITGLVVSKCCWMELPPR